jgi:uncharacterized repeat protein (TIGR04138 family)
MSKPVATPKSIEQVAEETVVYALEAFYFVESGLQSTTKSLRRTRKRRGGHVTGQELAEGLREAAQRRWGMLAGLVLERWGVRNTYDFGRIVYAMIDAGMMGKTEEDSIEDFRDVYDFQTAFTKSYKIAPVNA